MSKVERLLNLTAALLNTERPLSAQELRKKVEGYSGDDDPAFSRMFERDKDDLRSMGVPIEVKVSYTGSEAVEGYRISKSDYYLPDLDLTETELEAINLAVLTTKIDTEDLSEGIWKLGGAPELKQPEAKLGSIGFNDLLPELFAAAKARSVVGFTYGETQRLVSPWKLDFRRGKWYLVGFDHDRNAERNFRLDRIDGRLEAHETQTWVGVTADRSADRKPWEFGDDFQTCSLQVDQVVAKSMAAALGGSAKKVTEFEGSVVFEVRISAIEPFFSLVLDYLDAAQILEPPELVEKFVTHVAKVRQANV